MTISNRQGRALEYIICKELSIVVPKLIFTENANSEQKRDANHFDDCTKNLQESYNLSAKIVGKWLNDSFSLHQKKSVTLDRLPDSSGVSGDVTDIRLKFDDNVLNLSIKHNHMALKHPRLTKVPSWIIIKDKKIIEKYLEDYKLTWSNIIKDTKSLMPSVKKFNELDAVIKDYKNKNIYYPLCALVMNFLNSNINNNLQVANLFNFLVGNTNFYKIIDFSDRIEILNFSKILSPMKVAITQPLDSYLSMDFDNGWVLSLRLHTASTLLESKSIKFDVQGKKINIVEKIILKKG